MHVICVRTPTCILRFASQCGAVGSAIATGHAIGIDTSHACVSCVGRHRRKSQDRAQRARRAAEPFPIDYSAPQHTYNPHFDSLSVQSILTFSNRYETQLLRQESNQESMQFPRERKIKKLKLRPSSWFFIRLDRLKYSGLLHVRSLLPTTVRTSSYVPRVPFERYVYY